MEKYNLNVSLLPSSGHFKSWPHKKQRRLLFEQTDGTSEAWGRLPAIGTPSGKHRGPLHDLGATIMWLCSLWAAMDQ